MKLRCPIQTKYLNNGRTCVINQLFGENKNQLFYGKDGHRGLDLRTKGVFKYKRYKQKYKSGKWSGGWIREMRNDNESIGFIPLVAPHGGMLTTNFFYSLRKRGWGMFINWTEDGHDWRLLVWHIERPWRRLGAAWKYAKLNFKPQKVKAGAVIAIAGNTGYSTGPHVHLELQKNMDNKWTPVDPLPYLQDDNIIYQYLGEGRPIYFYKGNKISKTQAQAIYKMLPKVL